MEVLIVSKTKMNSGYCVGGIVFPTMQCVRLLNADGSYQPVSTEFNIGDFWEIEFKFPAKIITPHTEDVYIQTKNKINKTFSDWKSLITIEQLKDRVWKGAVKNLFEKKLRWTGKRNGYISSGAIPKMSTGFWIPDNDLKFSEKHYVYRSSGILKQNFNLAYVGLQKPIEIIPSGSITRVSLAKWWAPKDIDIEERCYLQLSGWY